MGYEISGAWGAKMALPDREVIAFVGDGSYLMMNSDLYSSVLSGHKLIVIVCDNGGFAVINRLQVNQGGVAVQQPDRGRPVDRELVHVDFAAHAAAMGCDGETRLDDRRAGGGVRPGPGGRPHVRDRHADRRVRLDRRRARSGRSACPRSAIGPEVRAAKAAMDAAARQTTEWVVSVMDGEAIGWRQGDRRHGRHAGPR